MNNFYLMVFNVDYADEHDVPALNCFTEQEYNNWLITTPELYTYLGNSGEGFLEEIDEETVTGQYFIDNNYVHVTEVDESFYKTFHKANLSNLSLYSIFD